jgi:hypothetical protein
MGGFFAQKQMPFLSVFKRAYACEQFTLYLCIDSLVTHCDWNTSSGNNLANPLVIIVNKTCVSSQMDIARLDQRKVTPRAVQFYLISAIASFLLPLKSITENLFSQPLTEVYKGINTHSFLSHFQTVGGFTVFALALSCNKSSFVNTPIITMQRCNSKIPKSSNILHFTISNLYFN